MAVLYMYLMGLKSALPFSRAVRFALRKNIARRLRRILCSMGPRTAIYCMNDLYNQTIEVNGKVYHYDPDQDIYYHRGENSVNRYEWIIIVALIAFVAIYVEFLR